MAKEYKFFPALNIQRRVKVSNIIESLESSCVLDLGCGTGSLLELLINRDSSRTLGGLEISNDIFKAHSLLSPRPADFTNLRPHPLDLNLYHGSFLSLESLMHSEAPIYDTVTCIEVIEHLSPDTLACFTQVLFQTYHPRIIIISTPNADFNHFFPSLMHGTPEALFRHTDHKFEFTRLQFKNWANEICEKYHYDVEFDGVGIYDNIYDYGHCTQIAIFKRHSTTKNSIQQNSHNIIHPPLLSASESESASASETITNPTQLSYPISRTLKQNPHIIELISQIHYPYYSQNHTPSQILQILKTQCIDLKHNSQLINLICTKSKSKQINHSPCPDNNNFIISIDKLWAKLEIRQVCKSRENFINVIKNNHDSFKISGDNIECLWHIPDFEYDDNDTENIFDYSNESNDSQNTCTWNSDSFAIPQDIVVDGWGENDVKYMMQSHKEEW